MARKRQVEVKHNEVIKKAQVRESKWFPQLGRVTHIAVISLAAVLCFQNSLSGDFVFDDNEAIVNNRDVKPETDIWKLLEHDFWGSNISSETSHKSYRPLTVLTFRLNYLAAGGLYSRGFHVVNLVLHTIVCVLLYMVLLEFFKELEGRSRAAFVCALLFAVHPLHAECVAGIVGRAELLCALFSLLSLQLYIRACQSDCSVRSSVQLFTCCLLCVISVLCKEQGITVLGLCSAFDIIIFNTLHPVKLLVTAHSLFRSRSGRRMLFRHAILFVTGVMTLTLRWKVMGSQPPIFHEVDNPHSFADNVLLRILNYSYLYALNAWLCICPYWLCFDWSMGCVPVMTSFLETRVLAVLLFWFCLSTLLVSSLSNPLTPVKRVILLSLALIIVPFLPASNVLFRVGFVLAERVLYMPSTGFCMLLTAALHSLTRHSHRLATMCGFSVILIVLLFMARSMQRSFDWTTEMRLFESAESVCPLNAKVHYNVAKVHADAGNEDYAIDKYRFAIQLNPKYDQAMNNLANVLKERGEHVEAESLLERAVRVRPDFAAAWMNLGIVQATLGKSARAEASYLTALSHRPKYPDCYYNLGNLYVDTGRHTDALTAWRNATLQKRTHVSAWLNMIILLDNLGRYEEVTVVAGEALLHNPEEAHLHYNVANTLGKAEQYDKSEQHFLKAISLRPRVGSYYANLGVLYHRWGKYQEADRAYTKALELNPGDSQTDGYRSAVKRKLQQGSH